MNAFYFLTFLINFNIFSYKNKSKCYKNKDNNNVIDKDNKDNKEKTTNKDKNIIEKNSYFNWYNGNCALQTLILLFFNIFKNNQKIIEKLKNSNKDLYKKLYLEITNYNKFEENNNKNNTNQVFIDIYIEILKFFISKIIDIKTEINDNYWKYNFLYNKDNYYIYNENYNGTNKEEKEIFNKFWVLQNKIETYNQILDNLFSIENNQKYISNNILNLLEWFYSPFSILENMINKKLNKEGHKKYIEYLNEILNDIENNKNVLDYKLNENFNYIQTFEEIFNDLIKEKKENNNIINFTLENETITFEKIEDSNENNLLNNNFKKSQLLNNNFNNMFFIELFVSLGGEEINHIAFIYKDNNGIWWLNGNYNKIIKIDPELIKQQNFKQIMENYSHIMNYKFVGISYIIFKNIN